MSQPLLLIVDGESLKQPGLVSAMEADGWAVQWLSAAEAEGRLGAGLSPDLVVVGSGGERGGSVVKRFRQGHPTLPVLVLVGDQGERELGEEGIQGFLEKTQPAGEITAALRRFWPAKEKLADGAKLSSQDIFGDLVEELEQNTAPGTDPFAILNQAPAAMPHTAPLPIAPVQPLHVAKPVTDPPQKVLSSEDIFGDVLQEIEGMGLKAPQPETLPAAKAPASPLPPAPAVSEPAAPLQAKEFTLAGISGVHDPFDWSQSAAAAPTPVPAPAAAASAPTDKASMPMAPAPGAPLEEYGNYYLLEKIAVGGMAELFRAQQRGVQGFQKIVAIKRILPHLSDNEDFVTMFIDEAKLAAQLTHPNIVQIFDLGKAGTSYYIAMEYVNGRDLRTLLRKSREMGMPFPEGVAAFVTMKVAAALDYAHRKRGFDDRELKLVHRDISPQNVLISQDGAVKLVDFGIAKAVSKASNTVAGALKGKLLYMSPEQAMGQPLDNRSDLYSLGLVLFEMLTGERCFQADSELGVLEKVRMGRVQDIHSLNRAVSKEMVGIVHKALMKNVDHRYPSARFMERDLRELLMKQGHIPTEHDVAEYLQALLMGTKEDVQRVIQSRFPLPTVHLGPPSGANAVFTETRVESQPMHSGPTLDPTLPEAETLPAPEAAPGPAQRPVWLMPLILVIAAILCILFWVASRS
jgi:serine/threonine protein kinase/DNA-binding NarL/FixJ family response regulator